MKNSLKQLALFVSLVYIRFWRKAPLGIMIPLSNMQLLELLTNYPNKHCEDNQKYIFGIFRSIV